MCQATFGRGHPQIGRASIKDNGEALFRGPEVDVPIVLRLEKGGEERKGKKGEHGLSPTSPFALHNCQPVLKNYLAG